MSKANLQTIRTHALRIPLERKNSPFYKEGGSHGRELTRIPAHYLPESPFQGTYSLTSNSCNRGITRVDIYRTEWGTPTTRLHYVFCKIALSSSFMQVSMSALAVMHSPRSADSDCREAAVDV
jgi:hypothetical protein